MPASSTADGSSSPMSGPAACQNTSPSPADHAGAVAIAVPWWGNRTLRYEYA